MNLLANKLIFIVIGEEWLNNLNSFISKRYTAAISRGPKPFFLVLRTKNNFVYFLQEKNGIDEPTEGFGPPTC